MRLLIVDHLYSVRSLIEILCKKILINNFDIYSASNGKEALDILKKTKIDLIISDIDMPIMNGYQFFKELETTNNTTPIIAMSNNKQYESDFLQLNKNIKGFLKKPFNMKKLNEELNKIIKI